MNPKQTYKNILRGAFKGGSMGAPIGFGTLGSIAGGLSAIRRPQASIPSQTSQQLPAQGYEIANTKDSPYAFGPNPQVPIGNQSATQISQPKRDFMNTLKSTVIPKTAEASGLSQAQSDLDTFNQSLARGEQGISQKVIPLEFQTGQLSALRRDAALMGNELETRLLREQEAQRARQEAEKQAEDTRRWNLEFGLKQQKAAGTGTGGVQSLFGNAKLSTGQKQDIADMLTVQRQIESLEQLGGPTGEFIGAGPTSSWINRPLARVTGKIRQSESGASAQDIRNNIGQIKGFLAKLRGGTSFTPNEQALLDTYTPSVNDSDAVIKSKLASLKNYINDKIETTALVAGGSYSAPGQNNIFVAPDGQEIEIID